MGSREDFFGGYDHKAGAGIVHVANHPISPGKKQWTWGNHKFGYAWDRNLTEPDRSGEYGPYIEIMAGVYTDNQPDFSFLMPGETKSWSQFWYAIHQIGAAQQANVDAAISLESEGEGVRIGVAVSRAFAGARILLTKNGETLAEFTADLAPGRPVVKTIERGTDGEMLLRVMDSGGGEIISYQPRERVEGVIPAAADEPAAPKKIGSVDELFVTGMHLQQYRHATVSSTLYWREGLRRDAGDSRCNNAMGVWHMKRGEFAEAEKYFRQAIARLTRRNANPYDGEAFYNLGLSLRYQMAGSMEDSAKFEEAYAALFKATWNQAWASAAFHALGEMDCRRQQWDKAVEHLDRSLRLNSENLVARNLVVMGLRKLGRNREADSLLGETREMDRLDVWGRVLAGQEIRCDLQARLDVAHDLARAGFFGDAIDLLRKEGAESRDWPSQSLGAEPMVHFTLGWLFELSGKVEEAREEFARGAAARGDYCFPSRVEEIAVLEKAMRSNSADARAPYYLGNLLYDRRRHEEAISLWEKSAKIDPEFSIVWRNLGIGYFNIKRKPQRARRAYDEAFKADPDDARVIFERDQLWKRVGVSPRKRLKELEKYPQLVRQRDDLSVELCALLNQAGRHEEAMAILKQRTFQPWEGGEGAPLGQHVRTHLMLGRKAMKEGDLAGAKEYFDEALETPANLGEARHLLANQSDVHFWLGEALHGLGGKTEARRHWKAAADFKGDFQQMSVRAFSEMTYYSALAMRRLGRGAEAKKLLKELLAYARKLGKAEAKIDYFATSLPTMLIFEDDLQYRQLTTAMFLEAQARLGLGKKARARQLLKKVLKRNPSHALAADLAVEIKQ
jgi:tetratricopeptide (TPR) repeat protein